MIMNTGNDMYMAWPHCNPKYEIIAKKIIMWTIPLLWQTMIYIYHLFAIFSGSDIRQIFLQGGYDLLLMNGACFIVGLKACPTACPPH